MVLLLLKEENDQWKLVVQQWSGNKVETIKIFPEQKKKKDKKLSDCNQKLYVRWLF